MEKKTKSQLKEMYRDLMGTKNLELEIEMVQEFVDYCKEEHGRIVHGGAVSDDGKRMYVYVD